MMYFFFFFKVFVFHEPASRFISLHSQCQCPRISVPNWQLESKYAGGCGRGEQDMDVRTGHQFARCSGTTIGILWRLGSRWSLRGPGPVTS